ncbi:hypothetical protein, partial [Salmonella sp. SAL4457]|uniref:hypothetical protein n=1 Tax=Salmonella sp. SAL4457 TaxID=3159912 RepID=UPI00397A3361
TLDNNDGRYVNTYGFQSQSFSAYLIQAIVRDHEAALPGPQLDQGRSIRGEGSGIWGSGMAIGGSVTTACLPSTETLQSSTPMCRCRHSQAIL